MSQRETLSTIIKAQFDQQVHFLQQLVRARSANPFTPETARPDAPVEEEIAAVICRELDRFGLEAVVYGISSQRPNVVCTLRGSGPQHKTLILTTHMDTIEPTGYIRDPWGAEIEAGRLYGVGVADAKAQIAAFIYAAHALRLTNTALAGDLVLAFVVDEETGACSLYGTPYLLEHGLLHGDAAIVGEPGDDKIAIGHRGLYRFRLHLRGEATHTGLKAWEQGTLGRNAILDMARAIVALSTCPLPDIPSTAFPNRKSVLTFPTLMRGGSGINVVPDSCEAYGDVRLLPGLSAKSIKELIKAHLQQLSIEAYQLDDLLVVPPAETLPQAEVVQALASALHLSSMLLQDLFHQINLQS